MVENRDEFPVDTSAFAERVAGHLRRPERLDPSFDDRLMRRVEIEAPSLYARNRPNTARWWKTERVVRLSPLGALALAAGISMFVALSTLAVGSRDWRKAGTPDVAAAAASTAIRSDTVNLVRFVFVDSNARRVELVGDFNEWAKGTTELKPSAAPGVWTVSVPLSPGRHEYAFIINGSRWVADPLAAKSSDDFGTESSVIRVGASAKSTT
ncbi:MAG: isoamylase early set domain-containing protein [Gemmatimonadaceae bacterium]